MIGMMIGIGMDGLHNHIIVARQKLYGFVGAISHLMTVKHIA